MEKTVYHLRKGDTLKIVHDGKVYNAVMGETQIEITGPLPIPIIESETELPVVEWNGVKIEIKKLG